MFSKGLENGAALLPLVSAAAKTLFPAKSIQAPMWTAGGQSPGSPQDPIPSG